MKEEQLNIIREELASFFLDIKAESVVLELENKGVSRNDVVIENKSAFKRPYRRDILKHKKNPDGNKLFLELSRNGIYDALPEGFFHKINQKSGSFGADRKRKKEEEHKSRLFFSPIENEFFYQKVNIQKKEDELIEEFYDIDNDQLLDFWNLNEYANNKYVLKLLRVLPHCNKIAGDFKLIQLCLEKIIEEKVIIKQSYNYKELEVKTASDNKNTLGLSLTTAAKTSFLPIPLVEFTIGPVCKKNLDLYHEKKDLKEFLNLFYSYFLPLEVESATFFTSTADQKFILNDIEKPIVGVSTII